MVRVFVFGATGFIGNPTVRALRRAGHTVYGLARTPQKEKELLLQEIRPIQGTVEDTSTWLPLVESSIDIVVGSSSSGDGMSDTIINALSTSRVKNHRPGSPRLGYIYLSGTWLHVSTNDRFNDLVRIGSEAKVKPPSIVQWRAELEDRILALREKNIDALILRPALLFGSNGSLLQFWWNQFTEDKDKDKDIVTMEAINANRVALIHQTDIAEAVLAAVDRFEVLANTLPYPVFDISGCTENIGEIITAAANIMGYTGKIEFVQPTNPLMVAMSTAQNLDIKRARTYLGWTPSHTICWGKSTCMCSRF